MPWTRGGQIFCLTSFLETKSFKTVQAKFHRKFNVSKYPPPQKSQIYRWVHKNFKPQGQLTTSTKRQKIPDPAGS